MELYKKWTKLKEDIAKATTDLEYSLKNINDIRKIKENNSPLKEGKDQPLIPAK